MVLYIFFFLSVSKFTLFYVESVVSNHSRVDCCYYETKMHHFLSPMSNRCRPPILFKNIPYMKGSPILFMNIPYMIGFSKLILSWYGISFFLLYLFYYIFSLRDLLSRLQVSLLTILISLRPKRWLDPWRTRVLINVPYMIKIPCVCI